MIDAKLTFWATILSGLGAVGAAVATIVLAILTARYVRLTNRLVDETRAARAPAVVVDIDFDEMTARLVVANRGPSAAHNVRIKVSERNLVWNDEFQNRKLEDTSPVKNGISFLPPGRTLRYALYALDLSKTVGSGQSGVIEFDVTYHDDSGEPFHEQTSIDFGGFDGMTIEGGRWSAPHRVIADAIRRAAEHVNPRPIVARRTRTCPACFEMIKAEARKCRHCLEVVEPLPPDKPHGDATDLGSTS